MLQGHFTNSPTRTIAGAIEAYTASSAFTIDATGDLQSFKLDRVGANKFFGYGVSHKASIKLRKMDTAQTLAKGDSLRLLLDSVVITPYLEIIELQKDENSGNITLTAMDVLHKADRHTVAELNLTSYTIGEFAQACAAILGITATFPATLEFGLLYEVGANFDGTESLREALNDVAEATHTIYFINAENQLVFKQLDIAAEPVVTVDRNTYFTLDSKTAKQLAAICFATELGDNITAENGAAGETAYIRDNAFIDLREDKADLAKAALEALQGLSIQQLNCKWRGNYLVEIADKLGFVTKDNQLVYTYLLNDSLTYNGGLSQVTQWEYTAEEKSASNPATLGEMLKTTYAKVDKQKQQIDLVAQAANQNAETISSLQLNTDSISATVTAMEQSTVDAVDKLNSEIAEINNKVSATVTAEQVEITIEERLSNGVSSVETATGFKFNDSGLTVSKSNSEISTTITEDGMQVKKGGEEALLTASKEGVKAEDLHATTFLIIGTNSRFEDYNNKTRTGCFWIGG